MTRHSMQSRMNRLFSSAAAIVLVLFSVAAAESDPNSYNSPPGPFHHPVPPYPVEMGFCQDHSSTLFESWQRGRAAMIQAWGNFHLSASQALILREQARWIGRENDLKWREARLQFRQERAARKVEGQKKLAERRSTVYREAYQLSADEFEPSTGSINWPLVLQHAAYQQARERVDELFRTHAGYGEPQPTTAAEIARSIEPLVRALQKEMRNLPRNDYLAAQRFLIGLKFEAESLAEAA